MRVLLTSLVLAMATALTACDSGTASQSKTAVTKAADPYAASAAGHHFTTGNPAAQRTIYVYFDAQCSHCGQLWKNMKGLSSQVRTVWIPVGLLNNASVSQGAALLASANPEQAMDEHERALAAKQGGMKASYPDSAARKLIEDNTRLWESMGEQGVPLIVAKDASGKLVKQTGAYPEDAIRTLLGIPRA